MHLHRLSRLLRGDSVVLSTLIAGTALMLMLFAFARFYGTMFNAHESRLTVLAEQLNYPSMSIGAVNSSSAKSYTMLRLKINPMGYRIAKVVIHYRHGSPPVVPVGCRTEGRHALICTPRFNATSGYYFVEFPMKEREEVLIEALTPNGARYFYRLDKDPKHPYAPAKYWVSLRDLLSTSSSGLGRGDAPALTSTDQAIVCGVLRAYYGIVCGRDVNPASFKPVVIHASWRTSDLSTWKLRLLGVSIVYLATYHVVPYPLLPSGSVKKTPWGFYVNLGTTRVRAEATLTITAPSGRVIFSKHFNAEVKGHETLSIRAPYLITPSLPLTNYAVYELDYKLTSPIRTGKMRIYIIYDYRLAKYPALRADGRIEYYLNMHKDGLTLTVNFTKTGYGLSYERTPPPGYYRDRRIYKGGGYALLSIRLPWLVIPLSIKSKTVKYNYAITYNSTTKTYAVYPGAKYHYVKGYVEVVGFNGTHILAYMLYKSEDVGPAHPPDMDVRESLTPPPPPLPLTGSVEIVGVLVPINTTKVRRSPYVFLDLGGAAPPGVLSRGLILAGHRKWSLPRGVVDVYVPALILKPVAPGLPPMSIPVSSGSLRTS